GASELLIGEQHWRALPPHLKLIIEMACRAEHGQSLHEAEQANARALRLLVEQGAQAHVWADDIVSAARAAARDVLGDVAATGVLADKIVRSQQQALDDGRVWRRLQSAN
ncbi:MAG: hypothetical protein ACRCTD_10945, partial [Beijerinckiaceae bacterium]